MAQNLRPGDRVRCAVTSVVADAGWTGVVDRDPENGQDQANSVAVKWDGHFRSFVSQAHLQKMSSQQIFDVELKRGDRVRTPNGDAGTVESVASRYVVVSEDSGYTWRGLAEDCQRMETTMAQDSVKPGDKVEATESFWSSDRSVSIPAGTKGTVKQRMGSDLWYVRWHGSGKADAGLVASTRQFRVVMSSMEREEQTMSISVQQVGPGYKVACSTASEADRAEGVLKQIGAKYRRYPTGNGAEFMANGSGDKAAAALGVANTMDLTEVCVEPDGGVEVCVDPSGDEAMTMANGYDVARDRNWAELRVGDRVSGHGGTFKGKVERVIQANIVRVKWDNGSAANEDTSGLTKMAVDPAQYAVMSATIATCPYCSRSVAMDRGTLGSHRAHGGVCDGAGRRVATLDRAGRATLMAHPGELKPGDRVRQRTISGTVYVGTVKSVGTASPDMAYVEWDTRQDGYAKIADLEKA